MDVEVQLAIINFGGFIPEGEVCKTLRVCKTCGIPKSLAEFQRRPKSTGYWHLHCRKCVSIRVICKKLGITRREYLALPNECEICGDTANLVVDHCHETGKVRGRLCNSCNLMIGHAFDQTWLLEQGIKYLENHDTDR